VDIKEAGTVGGDVAKHWYYRAKLAALRRLTDGLAAREVLDIGAGSGFFARQLLLHTDIAAATCVDPGYIADSDEFAGGKLLRLRRAIARSDADLVLMMDVLEHVADDAALLRDYVAMIGPATHVLVTVPAFAFLWSGHDIFLEHHRRYTLAGIERVVAGAGLHIVRGCYFYGALFPLVAAIRLAARARAGADDAPRSDMRGFSPLANAVLWRICRAELAVLPANRLGGLTAFVLAAKP
jgi:SAM-dependent methyltransferase